MSINGTGPSAPIACQAARSDRKTKRDDKEKQMGTIALSQNTSLDGARTFPSGTVIHAYRPHEGIR